MMTHPIYHYDRETRQYLGASLAEAIVARLQAGADRVIGETPLPTPLPTPTEDAG